MNIQWPRFPELEIELDFCPDALTQKTYTDARAIVEQGLIDLCEEGSEVYLTALMNQDLEIVNLVGDVILGRSIEEGDTGEGDAGQQIRGVVVPAEVEESRVWVEAIDRGCPKHRDDPEPDKCKLCKLDQDMSVTPGKASLRYKDGSEKTSTRSAGRSRRTKHAQQQYQDRWVDLGKTEGYLTLKQAWLTLRLAGAYVKRAPHPDDQAASWLYREVPPSELAARKRSPKGASK